MPYFQSLHLRATERPSYGHSFEDRDEHLWDVGLRNHDKLPLRIMFNALEMLENTGFLLVTM